MRRVAELGLVAALTPGCALTLPIVTGGYGSKSERKGKAAHSIQIKPNHPEASVRRMEGNEEVFLGNGPLSDHLEYDYVERVEQPIAWPFLVGWAIDAAAYVVAIVAISGNDPEPQRLGIDAGPVPGVPAQDIALALVASLGGVLVAGDGVLTGWAVAAPEKVERVPTPKRVSYRASVPGYDDASRPALVPETFVVELTVRKSRVVAAPLNPSPPPPPPPPVVAPPSGPTKVVAVMAPQVTNATGKDAAVARGLLDKIEDQLRVFIAQSGFRTVGAASMADAIARAKQKSYSECYDQSCQIELGKALAANYVLRVVVTRFGSACVLNGEMIDLRTETADGAASERGPCTPESFLVMTEHVANKLAKVAP